MHIHYMYIFFTGLARRRSAADLGATPSFHRLLSRPVALGNPLGSPWGPLGDLRGTHWGTLGTPWGSLGDLLGILGDLLGTLGDPLDHLGTFEDVLGRLGHALAIPWEPLTSSFGSFMCLLDILWDQLGAPQDSQRLPTGVREASCGSLGSILEASQAFTKRFAAICPNL